MDIALNRFGSQNEFLTWHQLHRATLYNADPDFRTLKILQDGHGPFQLLANAFDPLYQRMQVLMSTVGKIKPRDIHSRDYEFFDHRFGIGRRPDRANDLGTTHH